MNYKNSYSYLFLILFLGYAQLASAMEKQKGSTRKTDKEIFFEACADGEVEDVAFYIVCGDDVNARNDTGFTPLHIACFNGHMSVVKLLVENGAKINAQTNALLTALHCAVIPGHAHIAHYLLNAGADPDMRTVFGRTALDMACGHENYVTTIELFPNQSGEGR